MLCEILDKVSGGLHHKCQTNDWMMQEPSRQTPTCQGSAENVANLSIIRPHGHTDIRNVPLKRNSSAKVRPPGRPMIAEEHNILQFVSSEVQTWISWLDVLWSPSVWTRGSLVFLSDLL